MAVAKVRRQAATVSEWAPAWARRMRIAALETVRTPMPRPT